MSNTLRIIEIYWVIIGANIQNKPTYVRDVKTFISLHSIYVLCVHRWSFICAIILQEVYMAFDLTIQDFLITQWFNNLLGYQQNDEILFFESLNSDRKKLIRELLTKQNNYIIINLTSYTSNFERYENSNIILFQDMNEKNIPEQPVFKKMIHKIFLLAPNENEFFDKIKNYIDPKKIQSHPNQYTKEERYLYYFEKVDPLGLILNKNFELIPFIINAIRRNLIFWKPQVVRNLLIDKTSFKIETFEESLYADIFLLRESQILTSRLAVIIYRIANLNLGATTTASGRYFHKKTGTKSKAYNYDLLLKYNRSEEIKIDIGLNKKNFKAYDLTINESEITIRREIAKNLVYLKEFNLDANTISSITKLPQEEVEKLQIKSR